MIEKTARLLMITGALALVVAGTAAGLGEGRRRHEERLLQPQQQLEAQALARQRQDRGRVRGGLERERPDLARPAVQERRAILAATGHARAQRFVRGAQAGDRTPGGRRHVPCAGATTSPPARPASASPRSEPGIGQGSRGGRPPSKRRRGAISGAALRVESPFEGRLETMADYVECPCRGYRECPMCHEFLRPCGEFGRQPLVPPVRPLRRPGMRPQPRKHGQMPAGRNCAGEDCQTRLSVYNSGLYCSVCARTLQVTG